MRVLPFYGALLWGSVVCAQPSAEAHVRLSTPTCTGWSHASLARMVEAELRVLGHALTVGADVDGIRLDVRLPGGCEAGQLSATATRLDGATESREASLEDMELSARPRAVAMLLADLVDAVARAPERSAQESVPEPPEQTEITDAERLTPPEAGPEGASEQAPAEAAPPVESSPPAEEAPPSVEAPRAPNPSLPDAWWLEAAGSFAFAIPDRTLGSGVSLDLSRDYATSRFGFVFGGAYHGARGSDALGTANLRWGSVRLGAKMVLGAGRVVFDGRLRAQVHLLRATAQASPGAVADSAWGAAVDVALDARVRVALSSRISVFAFVAPTWVPYGFVGTADGREVLGYRDFVLDFGAGLSVGLGPAEG